MQKSSKNIIFKVFKQKKANNLQGEVHMSIPNVLSSERKILVKMVNNSKIKSRGVENKTTKMPSKTTNEQKILD